MQEDDVAKMLKMETPYLPDDGFSSKVMEALPVRRRFRMQVIGFSWAISLVAAALLWVLGQTNLHFFGLGAGVFWSVATLGFWMFAGLFAFVTIEEGVFEY